MKKERRWMKKNEEKEEEAGEGEKDEDDPLVVSTKTKGDLSL